MALSKKTIFPAAIGALALLAWFVFEGIQDRKMPIEPIVMQDDSSRIRAQIKEDLTLNFIVKAASQKDQKAVLYIPEIEKISMVGVGDLLSGGDLQIKQILADKILLKRLSTAETYIVSVERRGEAQKVVALSSLPALEGADVIGSIPKSE